jgi:hypothetical protein
MAGQGGRFGGHPFHQVSVAAHHKGVVVHDLMTGPVEIGRQVPFGHGHADGVGKSLAQRTGGGLDAGCVAVFGMAGGLAAPLPEILDFFQAEVITGQVQQAVEQHGGMAPGEHETVAIRPVRVLRIVLHHPRPQDIAGRGQAHGGARVAGVGFLHRIHGQGADGVDAKIVNGRLLFRGARAHGIRLL